LIVPAYRLDVIEQGVVTRSISVAVGQPRYPTPLGHFRIDYVVWNPWWRPPASDRAWKERPQAPGWQNPVGRVKLHVTGLVFLHGTPLVESRGTAASHACVRMSNEDAIALARLVHDRACQADHRRASAGGTRYREPSRRLGASAHPRRSTFCRADECRAPARDAGLGHRATVSQAASALTSPARA
jgi:hypothetical protein